MKQAPITIRPATRADIPQIVAVLRDVFHEYGFVFEEAAEVPDVLDLERTYLTNGCFLVAVRHGSIVGTASIQMNDAITAEIHRFYLLAELRGSGLADTLLRALIDWSYTQAAHRLELWSDTRFTRAHRFYERYGFVRGPEQRQLNDLNHSWEYYYALDLTHTAATRVQSVHK